MASASECATPKYAPQKQEPEIQYMRLRNYVSFTLNEKELDAISVRVQIFND